MFFTGNSPIAKKLMVMIVAFSTTITIVTTGVQFLLDYRKELRGIQRQIETIKTTQMGSLSRSLWTFDAQGVQIVLNNALHIEDIEYLAVYVDDRHSWSGGKLVSRRTIDKTIPIHFRNGLQNVAVGTLRIVASLDNVYERLLKKAVFILVGNGFKTFFVSFFILFLFQRLVTRHLVDLKEYATRVANGAADSPFKLNRAKKYEAEADELDSVTSAINLMRENLRTEIRKLKQAETTLRANEEDLKEAQRIARLGSWRLDIASNQVVWSEELYKIYGFDPSFPPPPYSEHQKLFTPESWQKLSRALAGTVATGTPYELELETVREDGSHGWMWVHGEAVFDARGQKIGLKGVAQDITERKQSEEENTKLAGQLLQAQKMEAIGNLAGGIAHDFNNILASIIGFTELALEEAKPGSKQKADLREVYAAGLRAKELIKQILAFARKTEESTKPVEPGKIITEVLRLIRSSLPSTIEIRHEINSASRVMANPIQIHQVILNLCTNAAQAMSANGGLLSLSLRDVSAESTGGELPAGLTAADYLEMSISDSGVGISPEIVDLIFDPYFTTKGVGEGTGMGLAMVKGIVEGYGGRIVVKSELGTGTAFTIYLPIIKNFRPQEDPSIPASRSGENEHILLVDDEPQIVTMGRRMLENLGYRVTTATSSHSALKIFTEQSANIDLVITDMTMPRMTGDILVTELRKIRSDTPIILCTGYSERLGGDSFQKTEINALVYKPFSQAELTTIVREVLDKAKA